MKKNLLIIDNSKFITGAFKSITQFAVKLNEQFDFHWALSQELSTSALNDYIANNSFYRFRFIEISKNPIHLLSYFPYLIFNTYKVNKLIKHKQIHVVHINDMYNMVGVILKVFNKKVKVVYHVRLLPSSYIGRLYNFFIRLIKWKADVIICNSGAVFKSIGPAKNKQIIFNGITPYKTAPAINTSVSKIVYIGNVIPGKGHDWGIKSFQLVAIRYPHIHMEIVGKYNHNPVSIGFKKLLDKMIADFHLTERIVFSGYTGDIESAILSADIVLNLSESESFSRVCLEALALGIPLIAADSGGPAELFEHGISGFLVPVRNSDAAADCIKQLAENFELRKSFSEKGREFAQRKFDLQVNANLLAKVYKDLTPPG